MKEKLEKVRNFLILLEIYELNLDRLNNKDKVKRLTAINKLDKIVDLIKEGD